MKIAVITGGETGERDVSLRSAHNISHIIDFAEVETYIFLEGREKFISNSKNIDLVIPVIHGKGGEDGSLQGLCEHLNIPYVFSGISTHAIAIDKVYTKEIVASLGIVTPEHMDIFPCFAKPRYGGSSVASKLCNSREELEELILNNTNLEFVTEKPIKGREFTVGIIERGEERLPLPVIEIIPRGTFFDFENKYNPEKLASEICPARIEDSLASELQRQALVIHSHLKAKHISRSDFIITEDGRIFFLEINTIPGMTETSLIPKMLKIADLSLRELIKGWCENEVNA